MDPLIFRFAMPVIGGVIGMGVGHFIAYKTMGAEVTRRNLRYSGFCLGVLLTLMFAFSQFGLISFYISLVFGIVYIIGTAIWLVNLPTRRQKAGALIVDVGRLLQNRLMLFAGLLQIFALFFLSLWLILPLIGRVFSLGTKTYFFVLVPSCFFLIVILINATYFIVVSLNGLELRENGLYFMGSLIQWEKMTSYHWESSKPKTLTIRFKPNFPLLPGFMSMTIPSAHKETVDLILQDHIPAQPSA